MAIITQLQRTGLTIIGCLCLLLFIRPHCFPQEKPQPIDKIRPGDTLAITMRLDTAWDIMSFDPDRAAAIHDQCLNDSRKLGFSYGTARALTQQGQLLMAQGKYDESFSLFVEAITLFNRTGRGKGELPRMLTLLGDVRHYKGNYEEALKYHLKALEVAANTYPEPNTDYIYINIAGDLGQIGRDPQHINYYLNQAEQMAFRHGNYAALGKIYNNKGYGYMPSKNWDSSLYYFRKTLDFSQASGDTEMAYIALLNLGVVWLEKDQTDSALVYLLEAKKGMQELSAAAREHLEGTLGRAYLQKGQTSKAMPLLLKQYKQAITSGNLVSIRAANYNMSRLYGSLGQYKEAYRTAWEFINTNDKLAGSEVVNEVNKVEVNYRTAEKEKEIIGNQLRIARQEKELESKNKWITIVVCSAIGLLLLSLLVWNRYSTRQKLLEKNIRFMQQSAEIETLRATIKGEEKERLRLARELHDGLGAMTSAARINMDLLGQEQYSATGRNLLQSTTELLDEISADLRFTAHNMMPRALTEKNLPEAVATFCDYLGRNKNLAIRVETFGEFETLPEIYLLSTYRIIQELVHNAEKHANASDIRVQLSYRDKLLSITVEDNGSGFDMDTTIKQTGMGLDSVRSRVRNQGGTLTVNSEANEGTSVYVEIPTVIS